MINKKIILSVLIIGCIATVAGAGTWAYFEDTKESTENSISTGTLTLSIDQSALEKFTYPNLAPGDKNENAKTIVVKNSGSITGHLYADVTANSVPPEHLKVMLNGKDISKGMNNIDLGELNGKQNGQEGGQTNVIIGYNFENINNNQKDEQGKSVIYTITYRLKQK